MALNELPGFQAYYDAQLTLLRGLGVKRPDPLDHEDWMRRHQEDAARSDRVHKLRHELLPALRPSDVAELLDAIDGDEITLEQRPLVFLLADLSRGRDSRLTPADGERFAQMLEHKMRHAYPRDGGLYTFLRGIDRERAAVALLAALDRINPANLPTKEADVLTRDLGSVPKDRALPALQRLAALGGDIGAMATKGLERLGHFAPGRIEEVAARWRQTGTRDDINWLYDYVITRYGEGVVPIDRLRELLGEPAQSMPYMDVWETDEEHPIALNVGFDAAGKIVSYKLK